MESGRRLRTPATRPSSMPTPTPRACSAPRRRQLATGCVAPPHPCRLRLGTEASAKSCGRPQDSPRVPRGHAQLARVDAPGRSRAGPGRSGHDGASEPDAVRIENTFRRRRRSEPARLCRAPARSTLTACRTAARRQPCSRPDEDSHPALQLNSCCGGRMPTGEPIQGGVEKRAEQCSLPPDWSSAGPRAFPRYRVGRRRSAPGHRITDHCRCPGSGSEGERHRDGGARHRATNPSRHGARDATRHRDTAQHCRSGLATRRSVPARATRGRSHADAVAASSGAPTSGVTTRPNRFTTLLIRT